MSSLKVRQIKAKLKELFEEHLDLNDLSSVDAELENKTLSRCLAAFAIYQTAGCSAKEAAMAVWDGEDDGGIDAAFVDANDSKVILAQAKWIASGSGEPSARDILPFTQGIKDVVEQEQSSFHVRLHERLMKLGEALNVPGTTIEIVLISTGKNQLSRHATSNLNRILKELNGNEAEQPIAHKKVLGLSDVYDALASDHSQDRITIDANILDWSIVSEPQLAYFGIIDGLQLKEWWISHGKRLVAKNIRHALGATEVNNEIRHTAINNPEHFWYFNNGITLVAEQTQKAPKGAASRSSGIFQLKGASIVNGAQTVSTLGRVENDESLGRVRVPIRIILLGSAPASFGNEVTRTNNFQNRIEARDFVAQDPEQLRIKTEMGIEGVDYQFLRSVESSTTSNSCELVEVTTALACAAADPGLAVQIKTGISRFFQDLERPPYITLFNPSLSGTKAFNATLAQREIDIWIETKKQSINKKSGFPWGALVHGNRIISSSVFKLIGSKTLNHSIIDFRKELKFIPISEKCNEVYDKIVDRLEKNYQGKFLAVLFKNPKMSKDLFDEATK